MLPGGGGLPDGGTPVGVATSPPTIETGGVCPTGFGIFITPVESGQSLLFEGLAVSPATAADEVGGDA